MRRRRIPSFSPRVRSRLERCPSWRALNTLTYTEEDLDSEKKGRAPVQTNFSFRGTHTHTDNPPRILSGPRALSRALLSSCLFICMHIRYTSRPISVDEGPLVPLYACGCIIASDAHRPGDPSTLAAPSRAGNGVLAARYCTGPETALCTGATTAPNENECPLSARSPFFLILRSLRPSHFHSARRER